MSKRLIITEKPSVARDISAALGGFSDKGEYLESDDYVLTWAVGHLLELQEPQDYDKKLRSWAMKNLPIVPERFEVKPKDGQKKRLEQIRKLGRRKDVDGVINACDAAREGELIYRRIAEWAKLDTMPQHRLWLQSMTNASILTAFEQLRPNEELDTLADAAFLRSAGDWLIGFNATRGLTQRLKSRGESGSWSAGRVQTPTLKMLVDRERRILAHIPQPFWEVVATFEHGEQRWEGRYHDAKHTDPTNDQVKPSRIFERDRVDAVLAAFAASSQAPATEKRRPSKQNPPQLFDLTSLQREANRKLGISAKRTVDAAQRLYEGHKALTYPRTDSRCLPDDYGPTVLSVITTLADHEELHDIARGVLSAGPKNLDRILNSAKVSDHFAIVPTGTLPGELRGDDARVYDLVVRQFLAAMMGPATWTVVERFVELDVPKGSMARFRTSAKSLAEPGFLAAFGQEVGAGSHLPALVPGQDKVEGVAVALVSVEDQAKDTRPPGRFSEAQLLRMMETAGESIDDDELAEVMRDRGLGTPATRADTIERLVRVGYIRRVEGKLGVTSKGLRLMDVLERINVDALASPRLTGSLQHDMQRVQAGEIGRDVVLERLKELTRTVVEAVKSFEHDTLYADEPSLGVCPACGEGEVGESAWGYPCSRNTGKDAPCKFMVWKDRMGRYIDHRLLKRLLEERKLEEVEGFVDRGGRAMKGSLELLFDKEKERWVLHTDFGNTAAVTEDEKVLGPVLDCPAHEGCKIIETSQRFVCKQLLDGEIRTGGPLLSKVVCHREMSLQEATVYFGEVAKTEILEGFISKRGRPFRGALFRKPTGKHGFEFPPREPRAKKAPAKKKTTAKKAPVKKKAPAKKTTAKKAPVKKTTAKKAPAKKVSPKKA